MHRPVVLVIMDGLGCRNEKFGNAVKVADTPVLDRLWSECPHTTLGASGFDVGLPDAQMGNSEVGHMNIGAGRIVYQELTRISKSIEDKEFEKNTAILNAMDSAKNSGGTLHLMTLLSDGGVHSHISHLYALLKLASSRSLKKVAVHCFTDGRDTYIEGGVNYLKDLENKISALETGFIATVSGRYYAMDRDKRWDRLMLAYNAIVLGKGDSFEGSAAEAVSACYFEGTTDEFITPMVSSNYDCMKDGDSVIFCNFRPDRAREITRSIVDPQFDGFEASPPKLSAYVCMTSYDSTMPNVQVAFPHQALHNILGQVVEKAGMTQLRISETEKYAHVTFFLNGGEEAPSPHEKRILVPSSKVATYNLLPEMRAEEITDNLLEANNREHFNLIVVNYANCDMVGHTGSFTATVRAVETTDRCVGRLIDGLLPQNAAIMITADHGNADQMYFPNGTPMTAHSLSRVPFIVVGPKCELRENGKLCDIAPTTLRLLGIEQPPEMTGKSLII